MSTTRKWIFWIIGIAGFFLFLYLIRSILLPFVVGVLTAYFLDPAADKLEKWGASRLVATTTITLSFFGILLIIILSLSPVIVEQARGLLQDFPGYIASFQEEYASQIRSLMVQLSPEQKLEANKAISSVSGTLMEYVGGIATSVLQSGIALVNLVSLLFITPVVAFYLLKDWDKIVDRINILLPRQHAPTIREQIKIIDETLSGFIRGQTNVCLILATYYAVALSLVGLKFGIVIGILGGFLVIIPYAGILFATVFGVAVAFFQFGDLGPVAIVLAIFVSGQMIEGTLITPKLVGDKVGLHPLWIIFGMLAGAALFGFVGILLAVPVTAVIGVLVRFALCQYLKSTLYDDHVKRKRIVVKRGRVSVARARRMPRETTDSMQ